MGCCLSSQSQNGSPYPHNEPSSSSRAITSPTSSPTLPRPSTTGSAQRAAAPSLAQHRNKPLKRHVWTSRRSRPWTRREIDKERAEFFDTRVTGRPEVWQSIHAALGFLWEGGSDALVNAQALLSAAEITVPSGNLTGQVYDSLGALYSLPEHIVSDPVNIRADEEENSGGRGEREREDLSEGSEETTDSVRRRRREDKGKAVAPPESEMIKVRVRLSDGRPDIMMKLSKEESIRSLQRRVLDDNGLPPDKKIKMIYMGRHLKESSSLLSENWSEGHIVNAFLCG